MADRFLVYTKVCDEMWDANIKCRAEDLWEDKYDGRGARFRKEYTDEVNNAIRDNLDLIKLERLSKGDL